MSEFTPLFPYMAYARSQASRSPYCLTQSGVAAPPSEWLGPPVPVDLAPPLHDALPRLEARVAELFGARPEQVLATMGTTGALHLAALGFFRGHHVVTESPSYEPLRALPELYAASWTAVSRDGAPDWTLPLERLERALATSELPGDLFLSNPNNPTGAQFDAQEIHTLGELAAARDGVLVMDEVYMEFATPGERRHAFQLAERGVSLGSLTKAYGLGGLRIGWLILSEALVGERRRLLDLAALVGPVDPPGPALRAGLAALQDLSRFLQPLRQLEHESRPRLAAWIRDTPGIRGSVPPLGLTAFVEVEGLADTRTLARYLAAEHGLDVVPGEFFDRPGHLRLSYGVPPATLDEALARLAKGIAEVRARGTAAGSTAG